MSDGIAYLVYCGVLWLAFFGAVAFDSRAPITRRSKQLGAVVFLVLVAEMARAPGVQ
jgi:hypothetical protein